jgi:hypothetical protein
MKRMVRDKSHDMSRTGQSVEYPVDELSRLSRQQAGTDVKYRPPQTSLMSSRFAARQLLHR